MASAQPSAREERLRTVDWFIINFVEPREVCMLAGAGALERFDEVLAMVRKEYLQAFQLVESTREYVATMAVKRLLPEDRFRGPNGPQRAEAECIRWAALMASAFRQRRYDENFTHLVAVLAPPT
jgi:hypothetical protein